MNQTTSSGDGPFRDAFERAACATLEGARGLEMVRSARRLEIELSTLMYVLSLGPIAVALATARIELGVVAFTTLVMGQTYSNVSYQREEAIRRADHAPRRVWIAETGILIEDLAGPARWSWDAVRGVDTVEGGAVLHFHTATPMALRVSSAHIERLRAQVKPRFFDRVGRYYLALALTYVCLVGPLALLAYVAG